MALPLSSLEYVNPRGVFSMHRFGPRTHPGEKLVEVTFEGPSVNERIRTRLCSLSHLVNDTAQMGRHLRLGSDGTGIRAS